MPETDHAVLRADPRVNWHQDVLRFADTDANGHINNTAFSVFCESGRVKLLYERIRPTREPGGYFVVAHVSLNYLRELHFPGTVSSATWISRVGRTSVGFAQTLFDEHGVAVATAEAVTVAMDRATRRPTALVDATRAAALASLREG